MQRLLNKILIESTPNDLLSLYLTDEKIRKRLNQKSILNILNKKYKIKSSNFLDFFNLINIKNIEFKHEKTLYLYRLEDTLYKPVTNNKNRFDTIIKLYQYTQKLKLSNVIFGLAVTLYDLYHNKSLLSATVCLYISSYLLLEYVNQADYRKLTRSLKKKFTDIEVDIVNFLHGMLIRPSAIFFYNHPLTLLSYFSEKLLKYKPSLIAETASYIVSNKYKIYTLTEMSDPCKIIKQLLLSKNKILLPIIKNINSKYPCEQKNKTLEKIIVSSPKLWHVGKFKKLEVLGEGVGGEVFKIKNIKNKMFAMKKIKNISYGATEISVLKTLKDSQFIINLDDYSINKEVELYLELGKFNLYKAITKDLLPLSINVYIKQLCIAIDYCHYNDIIHRDLKPDNVIFDGKNIKIIDFGLSVTYASFKDELDPRLGTITFMSPEMLLGSTFYNFKVDIWSLGLIFYFMITKKYLIDPYYDKPDIVKSIFSYFGKPTKKSWPEAFTFPEWKKYDKLKNRGRYVYLKNQLKKYYKFVMMCLSLNPNQRATTSTLLHYLK